MDCPLQRQHHDNEVTCEARNNKKIPPLAKSLRIQMICKPQTHLYFPCSLLPIRRPIKVHRTHTQLKILGISSNVFDKHIKNQSTINVYHNFRKGKEQFTLGNPRGIYGTLKKW